MSNKRSIFYYLSKKIEDHGRRGEGDEESCEITMDEMAIENK